MQASPDFIDPLAARTANFGDPGHFYWGVEVG